MLGMTESAPLASGPLYRWRQPLRGLQGGWQPRPQDDGERASGERTVVPMATALKGGCRGVGNRGPRV